MSPNPCPLRREGGHGSVRKGKGFRPGHSGVGEGQGKGPTDVYDWGKGEREKTGGDKIPYIHLYYYYAFTILNFSLVLPYLFFLVCCAYIAKL